MGRIRVGCSHCGKQLFAPSTAMGRKVKCSACDQPFVIDSKTVLPSKKRSSPKQAADSGQPTASPGDKPRKTTEPKSNQPKQQQIQSPKAAGRLKSLEPIFPSSSIALAVVGALLSLSIYWLTLVSLLVATIWFAVSNIRMLTGGDMVMIPLYVAAIVGSLMLMLLLLKPVFASRTRKVSRTIKPSSEPELMAVVQQIAQTMDAPVPTIIKADYEFGLKIQSLGNWFDYSNQPLSLTIGLPIMTTFKVDQFAILLATQLAPFSSSLFSQSWLFVIRVYDWMESTSWRPDSLDEKINMTAAGGRYGPLFIPFAMIWNLLVLVFNRLPFKILFQLMSVLSRVPLQNQQLNADQVGYRLVGNDAFKAFLVETQNLIFAHESSTNDFVESVQSKYSITNKFEGMIIKRKYLNEYQLLDIEELVEQGKTWSYGAVSSDSYRIQLSNENGVEVERPFVDSRILKDITKSYYLLATQCTNDMANQIALISVGQKTKTRSSRQKRADAINRYIKSAVRDGIKSQE